MKKYLFIFFIALFFQVNYSTGQELNTDIASTLEKLFVRLRENHPSVKKIEINDSVRMIIDSYSSSDSVFVHRFTNLRFLGQIISPDSLVKLLTWNLVLPDGENMYFCNIIRRARKDAPAVLYRLMGNYNISPERTDTIYSSANWYGALYYDMRPFSSEGSKGYILLGIDYGNSFITRKIIDVMTFSQGNEIIFGSKCFTDGKSLASRVIFEYSATAVMSLRFESDDLIVFDHLSPFSPELKDNRQFYGPDFSFDAYRLVKGLWRLEEDIDIKNRQDN
jgi:hypothetical protein